MKNIILLCLAFVPVLLAQLNATEITVKADGSGDYPTIQDAINNSSTGDVIILLPGTYTGTGNRNVDFLGKSITVCSEDGPEKCIIDCETLNRGFYFHSREGANSILDGLTIINGHRSSGGGIYCNGSGPTIKNCIIANNSGTYGAAIFCGNSSLTLNNCDIVDNLAQGGLIGGFGGGIYCVGSQRGGDFNVSIINCRFSYNSAAYAGGIYYNRSCYLIHSTLTITDCAFNENTAARFVQRGYWDINDVWVDGDYHLLSNSPCIDTGDPNFTPEPNETDLDGNPRLLDGNEDGTPIVDMGAYEYWPPLEVVLKFTPKTLNCDSKGKHVLAHITMPAEISPEDIDVNTPVIAYPMAIESQYITIVGNGDGPVLLEIVFDRQSFCNSVTDNGYLNVTVVGLLATGREFTAADSIRIITRQHRR